MRYHRRTLGAALREPVIRPSRGFALAIVAAITLISTTFGLAGTAAASGPTSNAVLNFQFALTDANTIPVPDATMNVTISIYDSASGGTRLFTDCGSVGTPAARKVVFSKGIGSVLIGDTSADGSHNCVSGSAPNAISPSLFANTTLYLGITVSTDAEMTPRKRIVSSGYVQNAALLNDLNSSSTGGTSTFIPATDSSGRLLFTGTPSGSSAVITANPASPVTGGLLVNLENTNSSVFKVDAQGVMTTAGSSGNLTVGGNLTVNGTGTNSIAGNTYPSVDNTYDLGSTSMRWHSVHVGPGSIVVHNDATNTQRDTLDFSGANAARLRTDSTSSLQLTTDANTGINVNTSGMVGINASSPATVLDLTGLTVSTNADGTVAAQRLTANFTKNDTNAFTFPIFRIQPTFSFGASDSGTTVNILNIDSTNSAVTGLTTNLINARYAGTSEFLLDSSGNVTVPGNIASNGGNLTTTASSAFLANANATTLNIGGAATSITIGANSAGTTTVQTDLTGSRRINAAAHGNNHGLMLPTTTSLPLPLTGQQAGDIVWDNSGAQAIYVYTGSTFYSVQSQITMQQVYNNGPAGSTINVTTTSGQGDIIFNGTQHFQVSMTSATSNTLAVSDSSLTTGSLTNFSSSNNSGSSSAWTANVFAITNAQGTTANSPFGLDVQWNQTPTVAANTEFAMRIQNQVTANTTDTTVSGLLLLDNADTSATGSTVVTDGIRLTQTGNTATSFTNGLDVADATVTNGFVVSGAATTGLDVTSTSVTTDFRMQNGATIDNHTNNQLSLTLNGPTLSVTSSATTQNGFNITTSALTSGNMFIWTSPTLTTGSMLNLTSTNNSASSSAWSADLITINNTQSTSIGGTLLGMDIQWNQNPSVAGNTEYPVRVQNQVTSNTTDTDLDALLLIDNADTSATGSTVITDGLRITNSGAIAGGITNGMDVADATITNGFVVSGAATTGLDVTSTAVTTDMRFQNGATIDNHTNGTLAIAATNVNFVGGTTQTTFSMSDSSLTTGNFITWTSPTMTTGTILNFTANNDTASNTSWSPYIFRNNNDKTSNSAGDNRVGFDVQFFQNPTVAGNDEYAMRLVNLLTSNTVDQTIDAMLLVDNADTSAAGSTVVTDGIRVTNSGAITNGITNGINIASATITNGFVVSGAATNAFDVTNTSVTTDFALQNGATITNHVSGTLNLNVGNGTVQVTSTNATGTVLTFSDASVTDNSLISWTSPTLTTGTILNFVANEDTAANTSWAPYIFRSNNITHNNFGGVQGIGFDVRFQQNPSVSGNDETAMRIVNLATSNTNDQTIDSLLLLDNSDTSASASTVVIDGIRVTNSGTISAGMTNGVDIASATITNGFVVSAGTTNALDVTSTSVTTDFRMQNGATMDNHTNNVVTVTATTLQAAAQIELNLPGAGTANALCHTTQTGTTNEFIVDCTSAPIADYAEQYPMAQGIEYGDIVTASDTMVTATNGSQVPQLVKATTSSQSKQIGVVVNNYSNFTSSGYNIDAKDNPLPLALAGRVPVKVTTEGGDIAIGDPISASSVPGVGMKATQPGMVIGFALNAYTASDSTAVGTILVYVNTSWWNGAGGSAATPTTLTNLSQLTVTSDFDMNGNGIYGLAGLRSAGGAWNIDDSGAVALTMNTDEIDASAFTVANDGADQTANIGVVAAGQRSVQIKNANVTSQSVVAVTFEGNPGSSWWISDKNDGTFTVNLSQPAQLDTQFTYWIVGVDNSAVTAAAPSASSVAVASTGSGN